MVFLKRWKTTWELKSLTYDQLLNVITEVIQKQLDGVEKEDIKLTDNLVIDYEADSVDIVAMLLYLEDIFKEKFGIYGLSYEAWEEFLTSSNDIDMESIKNRDIGYWLLTKGKDYQSTLNSKGYKELLDTEKPSS